jgi:hypothetical protein
MFKPPPHTKFLTGPFSAQQLEQAVLSGARLADRYLSMLEYFATAE